MKAIQRTEKNYKFNLIAVAVFVCAVFATVDCEID